MSVFDRCDFDFGLGEELDEVRNQVRRFARERIAPRAEQIATGTPDELKAQAGKLASLDDPTMEDAFIALIEEFDRKREAKEAA